MLSFDSINPNPARRVPAEPMRPPKLIKPYVMTFARQVRRGTGGAPFYVPCSPLQGVAQNECFSVVERHVAEHGGTRLIGWAVWERPRVYIEAEFHAIWRRPDGAHIDLAPRRLPIPRILFLADQHRKHDGTQVDNVRKPLTKDKDVQRFLQLRAEYFRLINEGDLKHQFGKIPATPELLANVKEASAIEQKIVQRYGLWLHESAAADRPVFMDHLA